MEVWIWVKKISNSGDYYITDKKIKNIIQKYNLILNNKIKKKWIVFRLNYKNIRKKKVGVTKVI
jgi:hypothetical protein